MAENDNMDGTRKDNFLSAINASIRLSMLEVVKQLKESYDKKFEIYDEDIDRLSKFMIKAETWMENHDTQHKRDLTVLALVLSGAMILINLVFHILK